MKSSLDDPTYIKVTLPKLARPNLVARFYMLCTSFGTITVAWLVPGSTVGRILTLGGFTAEVFMTIMLIATLAGFLDILMNDVVSVCDWIKRENPVSKFSNWLEGRRIARCYVIGGCYLLLVYAGIGSTLPGTFWLFSYFTSLSLCAGLQGWSLRYLLSATTGGGDAVASR